MLPGVECARKRRLHKSGGECSNTRRSFCLYTRNLQSTLSSSPSSLLQRSGSMLLNEQGAYRDHENLGGAASEAKRRLDERFTEHMKSKNQKRKGLFHGLWQQLGF